MDTLIQAQHELQQRIGRTYDNLKKDFLSSAEETYLSQRGKLVDLERSLQSKSSDANKSFGSMTPSPRRTELPKIKLPEFSGKYEDWPAFRDLFTASIGNDEILPTVEKLHYLRSCVQGEAATLIQNLPAVEASYKKAWKELTEFYENPRILVRSYLCNFLSLQRMKNENAAELKKIFHKAINTYDSLENLGRPVSKSEDLFVHIIVDLLGPRTRDLWDEHISDSANPPSFEKLKSFLQRRLQTLDGRLAAKEARSEATSSKSSPSKLAKSHVAQKKEATKKGGKAERCSCCQRDHFLMFCENFRSKSAKEKRDHVSDNKLCGNCLGKHKTNDCTSKKSCTVCNERHHTMLHDAHRDGKEEGNDATTTHSAQNCVKRDKTILLATARVRVADRFGNLHLVRALIDQGSEASFISENLAQQLKLPRKQASVSIIGVGGNQTSVAKGRVNVNIMPHFNESRFKVSALVLPRLTVYTGGAKVTAQSWPHLTNLELADPDFLASDPVDVLLGADIFAAIVQVGLQKGELHEPVAQRTSLGWILSGSLTSNKENSISTLAHQCITVDTLTELVRKFWEQEEVPTADPGLTADEEKCEDLFVKSHARTKDGRYVVRLPLARRLNDLSSTRLAAMRSLTSMERRFSHDTELRLMYVNFMREYETLGHMSIAEAPEAEPKAGICYLPHHGVLRESSITTKLRVVFNGSSTIAGGESLNKHFLTGKNLLPALTDILLRWRVHRFVIAGDIEKMYRQILVHPEDRNLQRIVWRYDLNDDVKDYKLNTVTYGLACAPFLAIRTLRQLADDEGGCYPLGAEALRQDAYVDDVLTGAGSLKETKEVRNQLISLCRAGGFPLKKWAANHAELLSDLSPEDRMPLDPLEWQPKDCHTMLGLRWHPSDDAFSFSVKAGNSGPVTKRTVLSQTAQLFDPLGWLAPVVIRAKLLIQAAWMQGLDWDAPLTEDDCKTWRLLQDKLQSLEQVRVSRWLNGTDDNQPGELHGFADASERAYAAVVYLRTKGHQGVANITLVAAKSKVAPLKQVSLPRLELCAATLLARLIAYVKRILKLQIVVTHAWLDSTVALGWVQGHPSRWKTYVANRVAEVQGLLPDIRWHHIRGKDNPADCASRGVSPRELISHQLWWHGPPWLAEEAQTWPASTLPVTKDEGLPEQRKSRKACLAQQESQESELLLRHSTLTRLLRITAWCRRWLSGQRAKGENYHAAGSGSILTAQEIEDAQKVWIRAVQAAGYKAELASIKKGEPIARASTLTSLSPFVDDEGIMRVGGRLKHSLLSFDEKHPMILPARSHFTSLLIQSCHRRTLHGGVQQTLGLLRQRCWIPQGRRAVKNHIHNCVTCVRWRAATPNQVMADLPRQRVIPTRPFTHTGVDYAGPFMVRTAPGRGHKAHKAFMIVFVCMSTKAVHLDIASDYTADAFLAAFRRFTSRRGLCQALYSDCGTNFIGADAQLRNLFSATSRDARVIANQLAENRIQWHFNPPAAPHFGGLWEAAVKSAKRHVRRVLGEATLTYEEMATLLAQVEACLNSRPLQALTEDPDDIAALTPGHFLIGTAINAVPECSLLDFSANTLTRWRQIQKLRDHFWDRWSREYMQLLLPRPKWQVGDCDIRVGRLCLMLNENNAPAKWPLARIVEVHPGDDGRVRVVTIKTATSKYVRPVNKLVLLPESFSKTE